MGQRSVRVVINGYVDKGVAIDLANQGGKQDTSSWGDLLYWLGCMTDECTPAITITTPSDLDDL